MKLSGFGIIFTRESIRFDLHVLLNFQFCNGVIKFLKQIKNKKEHWSLLLEK